MKVEGQTTCRWWELSLQLSCDMSGALPTELRWPSLRPLSWVFVYV